MDSIDLKDARAAVIDAVSDVISNLKRGAYVYHYNDGGRVSFTGKDYKENLEALDVGLSMLGINDIAYEELDITKPVHDAWTDKNIGITRLEKSSIPAEADMELNEEFVRARDKMVAKLKKRFNIPDLICGIPPDMRSK